MAEAPPGPKLKSPVLAFIFNYLLGGFGVAYVLDHWLWALVNFAAFMAVALSLNQESPEWRTQAMTLGLVNGAIALVLALVVNNRRRREHAEQAEPAPEP